MEPAQPPPWLASLLTQGRAASSRPVRPHVPRRMQARQGGGRRGTRKVHWRRHVAWRGGGDGGGFGVRAPSPPTARSPPLHRGRFDGGGGSGGGGRGAGMAATTVPLITPPVGSAMSRRREYALSRGSARRRQGGGGGSLPSTSSRSSRIADCAHADNKHLVAIGEAGTDVAGAEIPGHTKASPLGPKQLYLLNQFLGFDKFTGREREDLVDLMVDRWLTDPFVGDQYRQHIELYCESSYTMNRTTSRVEFPNRLNTAVCCDLLTLLARKDSKYRRALKLIKSGIFASIFADYKEADEDGRTFLEMTPFYTKVARKSRRAKKRGRRSSSRNGMMTSPHGDPAAADDAVTSDMGVTSYDARALRKGDLVSVLKETSPEAVAETIERYFSADYRDTMMAWWQNNSNNNNRPERDPQPQPQPAQHEPSQQEASIRMQHRQQIEAYEQKLDAMRQQMQAMERDMRAVQQRIGSSSSSSSSSSSRDGSMVLVGGGQDTPPSSPPPTKAQDATQQVMLEAREFLVRGSEGHAQKVLVASIGNFPDVNPELLDQKEKSLEPPPELVVPLVLAPIGEGQSHRTTMSFMESCESFGQKALIHAIASQDPDFLVQLERPAEKNTPDHTTGLGTPAADPDKATDAKRLIDVSDAIGTKTLIFGIDQRAEGEPDVAGMEQNRPANGEPGWM